MSVPAKRYSQNAPDPRAAVGASAGAAREGLARAATRARTSGLPVPPLEGQLYRPLLAYIGHGAGPADDRFWSAALATQMVHEASLLHDDVIDQADRRRDRPSLQSKAGAARALLQGDRVLTAAYCVAQSAESPDFMRAFVHGVEATVAGEAGQMASRSRAIARDRYDRIVAGKTGALFGIALSTAARLSGDERAEAVAELGVDVGSLFQRIDDFLDYCPAAATGKPMLGDFRQQKWTWILEGLGPRPFERSEHKLLTTLFGDGNGAGPGLMAEHLRNLWADVEVLKERARGLVGDVGAFGAVLDQWTAFCQRALEDQAGPLVGPVVTSSALATPDPRVVQPAERWVKAAASQVGGPANWPSYFARNSRTFRFASRWFPTGPRERVTGVYAFCRFTDDLVDEHLDDSAAERRARLDAWSRLARKAYEGTPTGIELLDVVMGEAAEAGVSFRYVEELIEGVRMDLVRRRYETVADLRLYTFRVASVVGGWLTELFGTHDAWVLDRAHALGHAMQVTNILRDVGEDLEDGRVYLPADRRAAHGVSEDDLARMKSGELAISPGYRALIDELMGEADRHYAAAFAAVPALPEFFQKPVAVAAAVYRGIQHEIIENGYDNLTQRAHTRRWTKVRLGVRALLDLRRETRSWALRPEPGRLAPVSSK